ncbi:MAG: hypothetical protein IMF11_15810 [Proteobacteria bacterium]|nr:hypothetical protein [Pseudomonadota bacterium]
MLKSVFAWVVIVLIVMGVFCTKKNKGGKSEMSKEIETAIKELDPYSDKELESLARMIRQESWKNPRKAVDILHSDNEEDSKKAALVLISIGDLAMTPFLDAIDRNNPEDLAWDMETVVSIQLNNRTRIVKILDEMLLDKRLLKEPELPLQVEEVPPSRRVCDEAYIMMRRLFALDEDEEELLTNTDVFLDMSDEERDAEIERARKTKKWISLVKRALEEEMFEEDES